MNIAIIGAKYTGLAAAQYWRSHGHTLTVTTTRESRVAELLQVADRVMLMRGSDSAKMAELLDGQDAVLVSVAADGAEIDHHRNAYLGTAQTLVNALESDSNLCYLICASSTSVYGGVDTNGPVTEDTPTSPQNAFEQVYVDAENVLLGAATDKIKVCILRTGQIYGPGRELKTQAAAMAGRQMPLDGNADVMLVHRDDVVAACNFLIRHELRGIFNLFNDVNHSKSAFFGQICAANGLAPITWGGQHNGPRKVSNQKLKAAGFTFYDPDGSRDGEALL